MHRIDTHVHFYTRDDLARVAGNLPYALPAPHPLTSYLDRLIVLGLTPCAINNVHLSILPDSENVFASFAELESLKTQNPERYGHIELVGTILADPAYATAGRLAHPQIKGIRIVLHDATADSVGDQAYATPDWQQLYNRLRPDQHVHIYAKSAAVNLKVLRQVPTHVVVMLDHLGTCHPELGADDADFSALLREARRRGNVYFKGPGYRTSIDAAIAAPFAARIVREVGDDRLILEATDAPHVGKDNDSNVYADHFTPAKSFEFVRNLARLTAEQTGVAPDVLLRGQASILFTVPQGDPVNQAAYTQEDINFPVQYRDATLQLKGRVFRPAHQSEAEKNLPPVVFNSGFTGGVSMYGQLMGKALAEKGYTVMTYDVAGFFTNKNVRNTRRQGEKTVTHVSLQDQKDELLAAIEWTHKNFGRMPAVISWAMGSVASLAAVCELAKAGGEQVAFYAPLSYTRMDSLQNLRADKAVAHRDILALANEDAIPPFDTGTEATRLGYYPLDPATQAYVDEQLGAYTDAEGVDHWPGCSYVTAESYKECVAFDPEALLADINGKFPPALIVHGTSNTLHMPEESVRLHKVYPGPKGDAPLMIQDMQHGQQLVADHPLFRHMVDNIDRGIRAHAA